MSFFGLTNVWIVAGYILSFLSVAFCCAYAIMKTRGMEDESDDE